MKNKQPSFAEINLRQADNFLGNLPWGLPIESWSESCPSIIDLPRGVSRHPIFYINCKGNLYAIKEMPSGEARNEFDLLEQLENLRLPTVSPVGSIQLAPANSERSYLITRYLEKSLPYRTLFISKTKEETHNHLLDAMASLLVQLHLTGIYWGDCSLSNTLFRHDAGALTAYLVDAESVEIHVPFLMPSLRFQDLQLMEENVVAEMLELTGSGYKYSTETIYKTGNSIRRKYHSLWTEITRQEIISTDERYKIQERINSLNKLGFSIKDISLTPTPGGDNLRVKIIVADRNFHRNQLLELTGIEAEEMQASKLVNEIHETKAIISQERQETVPLEAAGYHWFKNIYQPTISQLQDLINFRIRPNNQETDPNLIQTGLQNSSSIEFSSTDPVELYCQVLEHKWYLSEKAKHDVGHGSAVKSYVQFMTQIEHE